MHNWVTRMYMIFFLANSRPKDKVAKLLFKVPVYFQTPMRISKTFLIVFVMGTGNMYFLKNL